MTCSAMSREDRRNIIVNEFCELFVDDLSKMETIPLFTHVISTANERPVAQKLRRFPPRYQEFIQQEVNRLLETPRIRQSKSPWRANVVLVPKAAGKLRFCIDFRDLNNFIKKDKMVLPKITELLATLVEEANR